MSARKTRDRSRRSDRSGAGSVLGLFAAGVFFVGLVIGLAVWLRERPFAPSPPMPRGGGGAAAAVPRDPAPRSRLAAFAPQFEAPRPAIRLSGRLVEAATLVPVPEGVSLTIRPAENGSGVLERGATDALGAFEFDLPREGEYEIAVDRGPYLDTRARIDARGPETSLRIFVEDGVTIEGRVVERGEDGARGVEGARVVLFEGARSLRREATSSESGEFRFMGVPDDLSPYASVRVSRRGYFGVVPRRRDRAAYGKGGAIEVEVVAAAGIEGRLVSPRGEPVAGAEVALFPGMELGAVIDAFERDAVSIGDRVTLASLVATTRGDGRFRMGPVPPLVGLMLEASDRERSRVTRPLRPLAPGEGRDLGDVALGLAAAAAGAVVGPDDRAAPGARVRAEGAASSRETTADEEGRFALEGLEPGAVRLFATAADGASSRSSGAEADLLPGERRDGFLLRLEAGARFDGVAVDEASAPVANAEIAAFPASGGAAIPRRARSDEAGRFTIDGLLADAAYDVEARAEGFVASPARGVRTGDGPIRILLRRPATIAGEVRSDGSIGPVFVVIEAMEKGPVGRSLVLDRPGPFREEGLEPGLYSIVARVDGVERARLDALELSGGAPLENVILEIGSPDRAARGSVVFADSGRAVAGARLELFARRDAGVLARYAGTSDEEGRFEIALPSDAEAIGLVARPPEGSDPVSHGVATVSLLGADATLDGVVVSMRRGGRLSIRLESNGSGGPPARATVVAVRADAPVSLPIALTPAGPGLFESQLEPGVYDVAAGAPGHEGALIDRVEIAAASTVERRVGLEPEGEGRWRAE